MAYFQNRQWTVTEWGLEADTEDGKRGLRFLWMRLVYC
jgi:hypothetical protein